jgi:hypothetical protein
LNWSLFRQIQLRFVFVKMLIFVLSIEGVFFFLTNLCSRRNVDLCSFDGTIFVCCFLFLSNILIFFRQLNEVFVNRFLFFFSSIWTSVFYLIFVFPKLSKTGFFNWFLFCQNWTELVFLTHFCSVKIKLNYFFNWFLFYQNWAELVFLTDFCFVKIELNCFFYILILFYWLELVLVSSNNKGFRLQETFRFCSRNRHSNIDMTILSIICRICFEWTCLICRRHLPQFFTNATKKTDPGIDSFLDSVKNKKLNHRIPKNPNRPKMEEEEEGLGH